MPVEDNEDDLLMGLVGFDQADRPHADPAASLQTHDDDIALAMKLQEEEYKQARKETKLAKKRAMPNA